MKKCLINLLAVVLVGCSNSPKPPELKNNNYNASANEIFKQYGMQLFPNQTTLREFKNKTFIYDVYSYPVSQEKFIEFNFLATHSNSIEIIANAKMVHLYRDYLINMGINSNNINSTLRLDKSDYTQFIFSGTKIK